MDIEAAIGQKEHTYAPPKKERGEDAENSHEERRHPYLHHVADGGLESDLEEQDDDSEAREDVHRGIVLDALKPAVAEKMEVAEDHPGHKLPEDAWLAGSRGEMTAELGNDEDDCDRQDDRGHWVVMT
jgi:hypothetical protein